MSKEMVISSTPHETRVTLLEDGQLCEIYIEREKEYALVGSIYKGRVTRVLPGMQSAFVDIGLDTDAFLYVTDVLEDIEEYDHIMSAVEGKVQKMEQQGGEVFNGSLTRPPASSAAPPDADSAAGAAAEQPSTGESAAAGLSAGEPPAPSPLLPGETRSAGGPPAFPRDARREGGRPQRGFGRGRDRGDRRGGRDRYGNRHGRELPPSKYASPRPYTPHTTEAHEPVILPGESLAKYRDRTPQAAAAPSATAPEESARGEFFSRPAEPSATAALAPAEAAEPARAQESFWSGAHESHAQLAPPATSVEEHPGSAEQAFASAAPALELPAEEPAGAPPAQTTEPHATEPGSAAAAGPGAASASAPARFAAWHASEATAAASSHTDEELSGEEATALAEQLAEAQQEEHQAAAEASMAEEQGLGEPGKDLGGEGEAPEPSEEAEAALPPGEGITAESAQPEPQPEYTARVESHSRAQLQRPMRRGGRPHRAGRRPRVQDHRRAAAHRPQLISELLKAGQEIIVQIAKEPLGRKGARITSHVALPGRFLVYMPTLDHVGVSRKIGSAEERARLRRLVGDLKGTNPGGFIVRTAAEHASDADIRTDVEFLTKTWGEIRRQAEARKSPVLLHRDLNLVERILRDYLTPEYTSIWVDAEEEYARVLDFVSRFQPELVNRVKLYTKETPILEELGIQQDIDKSLRPKVWLKSGGYIVINHTEALVAIDVNTGKYVGRGSTRLEDTIVRTNLEAVKEIVRQIRLRDLGGIIVIDFIDMEERRNRDKVLQALEEALRSDRAPSKTLAFNEFGLVAITRKRTKQALERVLCQPCPYCTGSGMVKSIPTICYEIQTEARKMSAEVDAQSLTLRVHPEIAKALKTRESGLIEELERLTHKNIIIQSDPTLHWEQYDIY